MTTKRKAVTISIRIDLLKKYKQFCEQYGYMLSRRLEILMNNDLEESK